jgi:hypothetical protein
MVRPHDAAKPWPLHGRLTFASDLAAHDAEFDIS